MKVTKDTVTINELGDDWGRKGHTVQLRDADPNEVQLFIDKMPASIKGKSVKYNFSKLCLVLVLNKKALVEPLYICMETGRSRLRWLDTVFQGQYLPSLSINYVALNKELEKLPPQLYQIKMKICYDFGCNDIGVVVATK